MDRSMDGEMSGRVSYGWTDEQDKPVGGWMDRGDQKEARLGRTG